MTTIKPTTVEFTVAQNDLQRVVERFRTPGVKLPVMAYTSDGSKQLATGTLYAINNQMTTSTGTVTLRASFANDDEALFPNEFVNVQLLVDTLHQAVLVPTAAVLSGAPGQLRLPGEQGRHGVGAQGHPRSERRQEHRDRQRPRRPATPSSSTARTD